MTFKEYIAYFETAAKNHKQLRHAFTPDRKTFRRMNLDELLDDKVEDLTDISLVIENPVKRGKDLLSDNKRKMIQCAFLVIKHVEPGDFDGEVEAMDETEIITEDIISKMVNDTALFRHNRNHPYKLKGFDFNSLRTGDVRMFTTWFGWRTTFELDQSFANNMQLDPDKWFNETKFKI